MVNSILIAIIVIGVVLVLLALLVWRRQKEEKPERLSSTQKKAFFVQFVIGIAIALMAAIFMFDGDILGENTAGISTVLGIIGIGLIATSNVHLLPLRRK
jgi:uncharacterized membrane protein YidH (DUF202 family)